MEGMPKKSAALPIPLVQRHAMRRRVAAPAKNGAKTAPLAAPVDSRARLQGAREPDKNALPKMLGAAHPRRLVPHTYGQADAAVAGVDALRAREERREERPRAQEPARDDVPPLRRHLARARRARPPARPPKKRDTRAAAYYLWPWGRRCSCARRGPAAAGPGAAAAVGREAAQAEERRGAPRVPRAFELAACKTLAEPKPNTHVHCYLRLRLNQVAPKASNAFDRCRHSSKTAMLHAVAAVHDLRHLSPKAPRYSNTSAAAALQKKTTRQP